MEDIRETFIIVHGKGKKIRHIPITYSINKYLIKYLRVREEYIRDKFSYEKNIFFCHRKERDLLKRL